MYATEWRARRRNGERPPWSRWPPARRLPPPTGRGHGRCSRCYWDTPRSAACANLPVGRSSRRGSSCRTWAMPSWRRSSSTDRARSCRCRVAARSGERCGERSRSTIGTANIHRNATWPPTTAMSITSLRGRPAARRARSTVGSSARPTIVSPTATTTAPRRCHDARSLASTPCAPASVGDNGTRDHGDGGGDGGDDEADDDQARAG